MSCPVGARICLQPLDRTQPDCSLGVNQRWSSTVDVYCTVLLSTNARTVEHCCGVQYTCTRTLAKVMYEYSSRAICTLCISAWRRANLSYSESCCRSCCFSCCSDSYSALSAFCHCRVITGLSSGFSRDDQKHWIKSTG